MLPSDIASVRLLDDGGFLPVAPCGRLPMSTNSAGRRVFRSRTGPALGAEGRGFGRQTGKNGAEITACVEP
jgi:hypothetical protein